MFLIKSQHGEQKPIIVNDAMHSVVNSPEPWLIEGIMIMIAEPTAISL